MNNSHKLLIVVGVFALAQFFVAESVAQVSSGDSPFERKYGDIKFLDAYFGLDDEKFEVSPGDENVPFTVVMANVGTQDITGIRGQLSMPFGFSAADGKGSIIVADSASNSLAGEVFTLTFFVNLGDTTEIQQYPGTVKVDYSRLRESGQRETFFDFNFKVTGDSIINMKAVNPFLISLQENNVIIEISNDGSAPVSGVDIVLANTQTAISSTTSSVTNVERVVVIDSNWDVGHIPANSKKYIESTVYVPESIKDQTLRTPMEITYFDAHGQQHTISRIVDFYIQGLIDATIYGIDVIDLSGKSTVIGEIINEGNEDALFGFVTLEPLGTSNIKETTQFIDEIEVDSPVPFNIPIEFDGEPTYGENDIKITVRYKDSLRDEHFLTHETTILLEDNSNSTESNDMDFTPLIAIIVIAAIGFFIYRRRKNKQRQVVN